MIHYCTGIKEQNIPADCAFESVRRYDKILGFLIYNLQNEDLTALTLLGAKYYTTTLHENVVRLNSSQHHVLGGIASNSYKQLIRRIQQQ